VQDWVSIGLGQAEVEAFEGSDAVVGMEGDVGGELRVLPAVFQLIAESGEGAEELFRVDDAVRGDGRTHVVEGVEGGMGCGGELVQEQVGWEPGEGLQKLGEGALLEVEGAGGEEEIGVGCLGEVGGEGEGGVGFGSEDAVALRDDGGDVIDGPAQVFGEEIVGAVPVVAEGEIAPEVEDGAGLLVEELGEPEERGVLAGQHGTGAAEEGGGRGVVVADGTIGGDGCEGCGEGGVDAGEEALPGVELEEVAVVLGAVPDAERREQGLQALQCGERAGGLSGGFCQTFDHSRWSVVRRERCGYGGEVGA
jgi:hypothetical protein